MRIFTLLLMVLIAFLGTSMGYRLITGKDLVSFEIPGQSNTGAPPISTAERVVSPTPSIPTATPPADQSTQFQPGWIVTHKETELWSGIDSHAVSFGAVPQSSFFQLMSSQEGPRLYVLNPLTQNYAYIDAAAVKPSDAPPESYLATPKPAEPSNAMLVGNTDGLGVYVRRTPELADRLRAWADGTRMEVLERGVQANGNTWHKVRSPDGAEGYIPAQYLVAVE